MDYRRLILTTLRRWRLIRPVTALTNRWYAARKAYARFRGQPVLEAVYTARYFDAEARMTQPTAAAVADCLCAEFQPRSVADVGCGTAVYLREFAQRGVDVRGYEGSQAAIAHALIDGARIVRHDLTTPLKTTERFDLVVCFEVAEHLPRAAAGVLLASLRGLGATIVFSAAAPGQGGVDHVNEQPPAWWIACGAEQGLRLDEARTQRLRTALRERNCAWWLPRNLLVWTASA